MSNIIPDSKVHGAYMWPTWGRQDPDEPHVGPMILAIWGSKHCDSGWPGAITHLYDLFVKTHTKWGININFSNSNFTWHAWWDLTMSPTDSLLEQFHRVYSVDTQSIWSQIRCYPTQWLVINTLIYNSFLLHIPLMLVVCSGQHNTLWHFCAAAIHNWGR